MFEFIGAHKRFIVDILIISMIVSFFASLFPAFCDVVSENLDTESKYDYYTAGQLASSGDFIDIDDNGIADSIDSELDDDSDVYVDFLGQKWVWSDSDSCWYSVYSSDSLDITFSTSTASVGSIATLSDWLGRCVGNIMINIAKILVELSVNGSSTSQIITTLTKSSSASPTYTGDYYVYTILENVCESYWYIFYQNFGVTEVSVEVSTHPYGILMPILDTNDKAYLSTYYTTYYSYFAGAIDSHFYAVELWIRAIINSLWAWYLPNGNDSTYWYWEVYNTDTDSSESANLAAVLYDISWYLGNLYLLNTDNIDVTLEAPISDLNDKFNDINDGDDSIWSTLSSDFDFDFDFDDSLSSLTNASKCFSYASDLLQRTWEALGVFNIPLLVALVLGVCMQFIGYHKYKV